MKKTNNSGFKGVYCRTHSKRKDGTLFFKATLISEGKQLYLGDYRTAEEAALAYDAKGRELNWPESKLNFPKDSNKVTVSTPVVLEVK